MNRFPHIKFAACSDKGCKRTNNEDAFGAFPEAGVFCVADGMGGGDDGEFASAETVAAVSSACGQVQGDGEHGCPAAVMAMKIDMALNAASATVARHVAENGLRSCGSTFVGVVFDPTAPSAAVALHAGDSRLYRYRNGVLTRLTRDHSVAELVGAEDEKALGARFRGMIVRAVGVQSTVEIEKTVFDVCAGDRVFLCSDGLTRMTTEEELASILSSAKAGEAAVEAMVESAKRGGGDDNITVVLIDLGELPAPLPAMMEDDVGLAGDSVSVTVVDGGEAFGREQSWMRKPVRARPRRFLPAILLLSAVALALCLGMWFGGHAARLTDASDITAATQLALACDQDTIKAFVRVVGLLDRHGIPNGFEERARRLSKSGSPEGAAEIARDVLLAVKAGVDYARDCLESKETSPDRRTERLRRLFVSLSPELDGDPSDSRTQARCAAIIREVAGWD